MNILVSACLLGTECRYGGKGIIDEHVKGLMKYHHLVPVCPEQLGGMGTPRTPAERRDGRVVNKAGEDVTRYFERGAEETRKLKRLFDSPMAILKERSPSCGSGAIYDGFFSGHLVTGSGVTAERLKADGCLVIGESKCRELLYMEETGRILETERLYLRKLNTDDFANLCTILQDETVMYAYEHAFTDEEVKEWLERQLMRYQTYGFGLWGVIHKETGNFIGQCGITMQELDQEYVPEIGYLFARKYWHQGFATEAAAGCKKLAFEFYDMPKVYSIIRDNNLPSRHVAERNEMTVCDTQMKHYYGMDMPHMVYMVKH